MYHSYAGSGYESGSSYYPPPVSHGSSSSSSTINHHSGGSSSSNIMARMDESSAVALLQHLDKNDLQHLLDNEAKLKDLVDDLPQVRSLQVEHDNLIATNKSLAEYNLSLQPKLEHLKHHVASEYEKVNAMKTDLAENKARLDSFVGRQSLDTMLALLQTETAKTEEESEQLADSFCSGEMAMEDFLSQYLPKRTETHIRRIKSERFAELIRDSQQSTSSVQSNHAVNSWNASPSHSSRPPYPNTNAAPYPSSGGYGMPQLNMYR